MNNLWDRLGISTSLACILHCLLTPLLITFLPLVGSVFAEGWFHAVIIAVAIPVAVIALWQGYRIHRHRFVLMFGAAGFLAILAAIEWSGGHNQKEAFFMIVGGCFLSLAHYFNIRERRRLNS